MKIQSLSLIIIAFVTQQIFAQNKPTQKTNDSIQQLKEVVVSAHQMFGSKFRAKNR
ncbi:MAG: Fe(3+) dicitrate transport protein, partial [Flavobacteriaceae bacterium]